MRGLWIVVALGLGLMLSAGATGRGGVPSAGATRSAATDPGDADEAQVLEGAAHAVALGALEPETYTYRSHGRRDPFVSLLEDDEDQDTAGLPGIGEVYIVGILWGTKDRFALAETRHGESLILREGDTLRDGQVVSVRPDGVTVRQHYYGMSRRVRLPIVSGEEVGDER